MAGAGIPSPLLFPEELGLCLQATRAGCTGRDAGGVEEHRALHGSDDQCWGWASGTVRASASPTLIPGLIALPGKFCGEKVNWRAGGGTGLCVSRTTP